MAAKTPIEKKIALLLTKAEGTDNEHERVAFMEQAERLMIQHGIDQATVDRAKQPEHKQERIVLKYTEPFAGIYKDAMIAAMWDIFENTIPVTLLKQQNRMAIIGYESDVSMTMLLVTSMQQQMLTGVKEYAKQVRTMTELSSFERFKERREFIIGFGVEAGKKMKAVYRKVVREAGAGTEVAIRSRGAEVTAWIDSNIEVGRGVSSRMHAGTGTGYESGKAAGKNANTGGTAVRGKKALAASAS